jgi:hypothetical protein
MAACRLFLFAFIVIAVTVGVVAERHYFVHGEVFVPATACISAATLKGAELQAYISSLPGSTAPPSIDLPDGTVSVSFSVTGSVTVNSAEGVSIAGVSADGTGDSSITQCDEANHIASIRGRGSGFLTGVFVNSKQDASEIGLQPSLDFTSSGSHFRSLSPPRHSMFMIGDGESHIASQTVQQHFWVPHRTTRLSLGLVSCNGGSGPVSGYEFNGGGFTVAYTVKVLGSAPPTVMPTSAPAPPTEVEVSVGCDAGGSVTGDAGPAAVVTNAASPSDAGTLWLTDRWQAASAGGAPLPGPQWLIVELAQPSLITRVTIEFETAYTLDWAIYGNRNPTDCPTGSTSTTRLSAAMSASTSTNPVLPYDASLDGCMNVAGGWDLLLDSNVNLPTVDQSVNHFVIESDLIGTTWHPGSKLGVMLQNGTAIEAKGPYKLVKLAIPNNVGGWGGWGISIWRFHIFGTAMH